MAGPWLRYGHLDNISNNCLIGAVNAYPETNAVKPIGQFNGWGTKRVVHTKRLVFLLSLWWSQLRWRFFTWARCNRATSPRCSRGYCEVIRSYPETNLKKQGMLGQTLITKQILIWSSGWYVQLHGSCIVCTRQVDPWGRSRWWFYRFYQVEPYVQCTAIGGSGRFTVTWSKAELIKAD